MFCRFVVFRALPRRPWVWMIAWLKTRQLDEIVHHQSIRERVGTFTRIGDEGRRDADGIALSTFEGVMIGRAS
jgi:hypothetical protein